VKWPKARHGHNILFRYTEEGIFVLRVLHSAMDIPSHLGEQ
jgi:plasmid stabilization system protein ParE